MRRNNLFWGVLILMLGVILLADQLFPGINVWGLFGPLALILLGVWFLVGRTTRANLAVEQVNLPIEDIREARLRLHHGAGRLEVTPAQPGILLSGSFTGGVQQRLERNGAAALLDLRTPPDVWSGLWPGIQFSEGLSWNMAISREIPLQLEVETGASETRLDLTDLRVSALTLKTGASSTRVDLPAAAGLTRVDVSSGAAALEIRLPAGVAGRIQVRSGLAGVHIDPVRFPAAGGVHETPGFDSAANRAEIFIETGVASVDIR